MAERGDSIPITVYLDSKTVERIDEWARKMGQSRSRMSRYLIEDAVADLGWEYDVVTSAPGLAIIDCIRRMSGLPPANRTKSVVMGEASPAA